MPSPVISHPRSAIEQMNSENRAEVVELCKLASIGMENPAISGSEPTFELQEDRFGDS